MSLRAVAARLIMASLLLSATEAGVPAAIGAGTPASHADDATDFVQQSPDAPNLDCSLRALPIGAAEASGVVLACQVAGAPEADQTFTLTAAPSGQPAPPHLRSCSGTLQSGAGTCALLLVTDRSRFTMPSLLVRATALPSGALLGQLEISPAPSGDDGPPPAMRYEPLPGASD